jgi:hypothetical protein
MQRQAIFKKNVEDFMKKEFRQLSELERFDRAKFIGKLIDEFKVHSMDAVMDGISDGIEDHFSFLQASLDVFQDTYEEIKEIRKADKNE